MVYMPTLGDIGGIIYVYVYVSISDQWVKAINGGFREVMGVPPDHPK